ncbi:N-acetylglucosamine-6-phosphate deacetylase [Chitiniphilus shinanonensis]|uniref:N-acetylglucosamine-6-phosphate deacetylase n=1 Tax=Chitiniphilus shinanonensis TaxID=553088 RepID=A0ABQ6BSW1_9NEIS|nr:N-acetylglucosamine-6-phosphate deacetylase [Chitiniphilus shinanonensis]BDT51837.1 N-acetyl-D-glucosamine-6-phosphate deacetylase [Chitiniphilus shinanonensis]GLS04708.1 N-acetylglucosamine-6-phosphate deacetylase [Chitiniphilus shinanonensis]
MTADTTPQRLKAARVLTTQGWLEHGIVHVDDAGRIATVTQGGGFDRDLGEHWLLPALVDSHVHGAVGCDVMDATHDALDRMSAHFAQHGVGAFAATTVTAPVPAIEAAIAQVRDSLRHGVSGAEIVGTYLEGPYFTAKCCGAHPVPLMRPIDLAEIERWHALAEGTLNTVALAAEKPGADAAIAWLRTHGVRVLIGHSDASYDETVAAMLAGARGVVHCYNGMRGLHHRDPGVVGAGLTRPEADVELIADGHHVHHAAAQIALRCAGEERLILITDAMRATGMPDGPYRLGELTVQMHGGVVRTEAGGLAGSTLHLLDAVQHAMRWFGLPLERAWALASRNPARALRRPDLGGIAPGQTASLVALTPELAVKGTWVNGRGVFEADGV